jgi:hypothetical protein
MFMAGGEVTLKEERQSQRIVSLQKQNAILGTFAYTEKVFSKTKSPFVFGSDNVERELSEQDER